MTKINFAELMEDTADEMMHFLPEDHEVDDYNWGDEGFVIPVFRIGNGPLDSKKVDAFRFYRQIGETDEETMARYHEELNRFEENWR